MGVTAEQGPNVTFGQAPSNDYNAQAAPNVSYQGNAILDPRTALTYNPGSDANKQFYGWYASSFIPVIDAVPSAISAVNIAASQAVTAGTPMTLVSSSGAGITVGASVMNGNTGQTVTGLLAIDTAQTGVRFGQGSGSGGPVTMWDPAKALARNVRVTTNADDSAGFYTVVGFDVYGFPMTETIAGVSSGVAAGKKAFKYIQSITPTGTVNSTGATVGTGDVIGIPLRTDLLPYLTIWYGTPQTLVASTATGTFVAAVTTTATATTGDVRGTYTPASATDGTKRLTIFWAPAVVANMTTTAGLVGVPQA